MCDITTKSRWCLTANVGISIRNGVNGVDAKWLVAMFQSSAQENEHAQRNAQSGVLCAALCCRNINGTTTRCNLNLVLMFHFVVSNVKLISYKNKFY